MFLGTYPLPLNMRPLVAYNLSLAARGANAMQGGTASLHTVLSRTKIHEKLRSVERDPSSTLPHRIGLQGMLAARNVGTIFTVPLDFAFGTGRWEDLGRASVRPVDFFTESLAHPCSLGVGGAAIAVTVGLWSVVVAFGTALAAAAYAGVQVLTRGRPADLANRYRAAQRKILSTPTVSYVTYIAASTWLFGARTLGGTPLLGSFVRTPFVRGLPSVAPLALLGPTWVLFKGRLLTGLLKATISGAGYGAGYLAGHIMQALEANRRTADV